MGKMYSVKPGSPHPLGATPDAGGVNFSVFSRNATSIELLLFDEHDHPEPVQTITLDPRTNKSFHFWHAYVEGLKPGMHYAYRVDGPRDIHEGHRFNPNKVLIDPYARGNTNNLWNRVDACGDGDNLATSLRSVVIDTSEYDWEGDTPLKRPSSDLVVYEMNVGGFTKAASSGVAHPGTYAGVAEKIPYLKDLGITAVELLPVMEFDDKETIRVGPDGEVLKNYWGYSTVGFFAPHRGYCVSPEAGTHIEEFRDMVKALHRAGIAVILDVVFNHTNEGNHQGPTISFKGLDNSIYYYTVENDKQYYMDYSGCGNTVNCNHPIVDKFILECLEFWVKEMHVDGFRFDEGSILSRGQDGAPMPYPPVVWHIELSETLADSFIVAEAWDAAGLYQIGYFPGYRWAEWNGKYRDDLRDFIKGEPGKLSAVANRIAGSSDLYEKRGHLPINSVNFINCHDGFTLYDLVAYNEKHNWANGEENNDGANDNLSWNCGAEGETDDSGINALRTRQMKNFCTALMLSQGIPMFVMGDEVGRSQGGNNNAYCQDNDIGWFDWDRVEERPDLFRFFKQMIALRKSHPALHRNRFFDGSVNSFGLKDIEWHGTTLYQPGWDDADARALAFTIGGFDGESSIHVMINAHWEPLTFEVPKVKGLKWYRAVDTARPSPDDVAATGKEKLHRGATIKVGDRSTVVLISK